MVMVFLYDLLNSIQFTSIETAASMESDGMKPEFCCAVIAFNMDMHRLVPIRRVKEEPIGADSKCGGHD